VDARQRPGPLDVHEAMPVIKRSSCEQRAQAGRASSPARSCASGLLWRLPFTLNFSAQRRRLIVDEHVSQAGLVEVKEPRRRLLAELQPPAFGIAKA